MVGIAEAWKAGRKGFGGGVDLLARRSEEKHEAKRKQMDEAIREKEKEADREYSEQKEYAREQRREEYKKEAEARRKPIAEGRVQAERIRALTGYMREKRLSSR